MTDRVDHTWSDPVAMRGTFSLDGVVAQLNIQTDGRENVPIVGRLSFLSLMYGQGEKIIVARKIIFDQN